ncbi:MAG: hypothetical protein VX684_06330 [Planctomycetota bacterium]|nr:hypothetical protein [Planctomycetota bacterium]MED5507438.1 hypothetical protein [Planctomycetota bacterium]
MTKTPHLIGLPTLLASACLALPGIAHAQHAGDIGLRVVDGRIDVFGPLGQEEDTDGVFLSELGDGGTEAFSSDPGFDAMSGTFEPGRIGFDCLSGLQRWDPAAGAWLEPALVGEQLSISFGNFILETMVVDEPVFGFSLAVQPDGGWHRHVNWFLEPDASGTRLPGVYRVDLALYSTMGLADSEPFTLILDYEAPAADVTAALDSMYESPACPGDFDLDGAVTGADLTQMLGDWGTNRIRSDLSGDGVVSGADLTILLGRWGLCTE